MTNTKETLLIHSNSISSLDILIVITLTCFITSVIILYNQYYDVNVKILELKKYYKSDSHSVDYIQDLLKVIGMAFKEWNREINELHSKFVLAQDYEKLYFLNIIEKTNIKYLSIIKVLLSKIENFKNDSELSEAIKIVIDINLFPYLRKMEEIGELSLEKKSTYIFPEEECEKEIWLLLYEVNKQRAVDTEVVLTGNTKDSESIINVFSNLFW